MNHRADLHARRAGARRFDLDSVRPRYFVVPALLWLAAWSAILLLESEPGSPTQVIESTPEPQSATTVTA